MSYNIRTYPEIGDLPIDTGNLWMTRIPVVSTVHITREADTVLTNYSGGLWSWDLGMGPDSDGHLLRIPEPGDITEDVPPELVTVLEYFRNKGYLFVRLDPDGDIVEDLPKFEW